MEKQQMAHHLPQLPGDALQLSRGMRRCIRRRAHELAGEAQARLYLKFVYELLALVEDGELDTPEDVERWQPVTRP
jgi:hypothetical protein